MAVRHALRSLKRTPVFSISAILTLALGLAAMGSMFAVVHGVLLAPLPYGDPERLMSVGLQTAQQPRAGQPPGLYLTYRQHARRLEDVAFYRTGSTNVRTAEGGDAQSVVATWVTGSMMPLLQVPPLLGRAFDAEEELRGGPNAVILSESEWRTRFGGSPDVIGKTLLVNDAPRQIVGVMPARFAFPTAATRVWLPVKHTDDGTVGEFFHSGVARLAPGVTAAQARDELAAVLPAMAQRFPRLLSGGSTNAWLDEARPEPVVLPLREELTRDIAPTLWTLAAAAGLVLLVAWANVANLALVRADASQHELAVRRALGAGRLRLAAHFFAESALLGGVAGVLAWLATHAVVRALVAFAPAEVPRLVELDVGMAAGGFIALSSLLGVLLIAGVSALRLRRGCWSNDLHDGGRGQTTGKPRQRLRAAITALQIAVALVVLAGSALLLRTAHRLSEVQPGFEAGNVTTLRILLPHARYRDAAIVSFHARLTQRVATLPSVRAAGLTGQLPLGAGWTLQQTFAMPGERRSPPVPVDVVGNGYFAAMGIPLLAGRDFRGLESEQGGDIIVSRRAAAMLFGDADGAAAVGKSLTLAPGGPSYTVVGVVGDVRNENLATPPSAMVYRPQGLPIDPRVEPAPQSSMVLVVRADGPSSDIVSAIRAIVRELDPAVPLFDVSTMNDVVRASTARLSLTLALMTAAALTTLLLGMIGLYGVMAYLVALRRREFGVRIALGADPRRIARWVVGRGLALTGCGVAAGLMMHAMVAPFLRAILYGVTADDPSTLAGATLLLAGTATLASWLPARRAARVDPAQTLRAH